MSETARLDASILPELERIFSTFTDQFDDDTSRRAHRRLLGALASSNTGGWTGPGLAFALIDFAAELVAQTTPSLVDHPDRLRALVDELEHKAALPRPALGREALRSARLTRLSPQDAIDVALALVLAFAQATAAALWAFGSQDELEVIGRAGDPGALPGESPQIAALVVAGQEVSATFEDRLGAMLVPRWQQRPAALLIAGEDVLAPRSVPIIEAATPLLALALERLAPERSPALADAASTRDGSDSDVASAAERRLARLRFDLHDGPQQDLTLLAEDLRLFRSQLADALTGEPRERLLGRIDDLEARFIALDGDLRRISVSVQSPFLHRESFQDTMERLIDGFSARTGLQPSVDLEGDFTLLTDSQRITIVGLLREALNNVREHSGADEVSISVSAVHGSVVGRVADNGRGFDPETKLVEAARSGHLGLVGMHERVRLLGGTTTIDSQPGGPTVIWIKLPAAPNRRGRRADH